MVHWLDRWRGLLAAAMSLLLISGCGSTTKTAASISPPPVITVSPPSASLKVGGIATTFVASDSTGARPAVIWQVNGVTGGDSSVGTISPAGQYVSPSAVPASSPTITVTAVSASDTADVGSAAVTLLPASAPVVVTVSPSSASVVAGTGTQTFAATVTGSSNSAVTWQVNGVVGGNSTVGTVTTAGAYTAPAVPPAQPTVTVTAVSVVDSTSSGSAAVTITATAPPKIGGTPATTVVVGQAYDFKPTASGPTGLQLTFSISGKPAWATFNAATGELSGTPAASDVGSSSVSITVSDGVAQASLSFTLTVTQAATGAATVSWAIPTLRTDGSPLTNLAGFRVYYGTTPGALTTRMDITNPTVSSAVVNNLTSGTWYFAVTAVDSTGVESAQSNPASKTI